MRGEVGSQLGRDREAAYAVAKHLWNLKKSGADCPAEFRDVWEVMGKAKAELRKIWVGH